VYGCVAPKILEECRRIGQRIGGRGANVKACSLGAVG
jgi:hypothetical protein